MFENNFWIQNYNSKLEKNVRNSWQYLCNIGFIKKILNFQDLRIHLMGCRYFFKKIIDVRQFRRHDRSLLDFLFSCPWLYFFNARLTPNQLKKETFIIFFIIDFKGKKFLFFM